MPRVSEALQGFCDYAFYLMLSMAPSSRLMQGNFEDTDLLSADNFIRAAEQADVKHVNYSSGLVPRAGAASLVGPLQERLRHNLRASDNQLADQLKDRFVSFEESFSRAVDGDGVPLPNPRSHTQVADERTVKKERRVRSVQRMPLPESWNAQRHPLNSGRTDAPLKALEKATFYQLSFSKAQPPRPPPSSSHCYRFFLQLPEFKHSSALGSAVGG